MKFIEPDAWLKTANGKIELAVGADIHEKDRIVTGEKGRVQIDFNNGNKLNITPLSEVVISEASDAVPTADKKRMILDFDQGSHSQQSECEI